jgi:hypothetical protein
MSDAGGRHWAVLSQVDVQRFPDDQLLGEIRRHINESRGERRDHDRVTKRRGDQNVELIDEPMKTLGWKVETEDLEGDEAVSGRFICPIGRTERTSANRESYMERTDGVRRRRADGIRVQRVNS